MMITLVLKNNTDYNLSFYLKYWKLEQFFSGNRLLVKGAAVKMIDTTPRLIMG